MLDAREGRAYLTSTPVTSAGRRAFPMMTDTVDILVVEDDADNREVMVELLSIVGYEVKAAADGREALEQLADGWLPRLVILDLMMPGMNGWDLLAALKRNERWRGVPTLVVSAVAPRLLPSAGADASLIKPVSADSLLKLVEELVSNGPITASA